MAIRYLRRPPKPVGGKSKRAPAPVEITPAEQAAMAKSLAFFCVACGREHTSAEVREGDVCCAESKIKSVIRRAQL